MSSSRKSQILNCSLVRKRCACGKQVKAIQLTRYGACDACVAKAAAARAANSGKAAEA